MTAGKGNGQDGTILNPAVRSARFINPQKGTGLTILGHGGQGQGLTNRTGTVEIVSDFSFTAVDQNGNPIVGAKIFIEDVDNGNRRNRTEGATVDYVSDRDLLGTTDVSGNYADRKLIGVVVSNIGANVTMDRRTASNDTTDVDDFKIIGYNHNLSTAQVSLKGAGVKEVSWVLIDDANITETTKATVDAYTSIDNLDQLYDRAKSWKVDSANVEVPTISDLLFVGSGTELVLHNNWYLVLNSTATEVFDVDSTSKTITIKAASLNEGTKFKTLKAQGTGTITAANSELINVGYIDANGDSFIDFISALEPTDTWKAFSVEANRDANTSEVGTGNGTQNYRFNFTAATTIYLRIIRASTGAIIPINLSVPTSGSQAISFDPSIIAAQTNALVGQINDTIKYMPSGVFVNASLSETGNGSHKEPFNMIGDAVTYANANNVDAIVLLSNITLNAALMNHYVRGSRADVDVDFGGQNVNGSRFYELHLEGTVTGSFDSHDAHIQNVNGLQGKHYGACILGTSVVTGELHLLNGHAEAETVTILDLTGQSGVRIEIHGLTGCVTIANSTDATNEVYIAAGDASVIFAASNTAGNFVVDTAASLEDNSIGVTVIMNNILGASTLARTTNTDAIQTLTAEARDQAMIAANNTTKL